MAVLGVAGLLLVGFGGVLLGRHAVGLVGHDRVGFGVGLVVAGCLVRLAGCALGLVSLVGQVASDDVGFFDVLVVGLFVFCFWPFLTLRFVGWCI
ncbi:hypothetical protein [Thalassobaculum litoreum]|uniref:hypothetical protein n=1 Tax=Thalassobaculum litoreum TaxID=420996 RepID=UPI0015874E94|nr:hypothetical protein [Thalassobaculum litoreum]